VGGGGDLTLQFMCVYKGLSRCVCFGGGGVGGCCNAIMDTHAPQNPAVFSLNTNTTALMSTLTTGKLSNTVAEMHSC
jgi:hypothetical protein